MPSITITNSLSDIAAQIQQIKERIILIYAFNGTGKTRLSMEYKNLTKKRVSDDESVKTGIYYNAYTEDLFHWDNDIEEKDGKYRLLIKISQLNRFHEPLTDDNYVSLKSKLKRFNPKYNFKFDYDRGDLEKGISAVIFTRDNAPETPIKISRGEEQIFIFCFFLSLAEVEEWSNNQNEYVWIDDPVSSLDDNNIFAITTGIIDLIEQNFDSDKRKKFIITTHHVSFFALLANWFTKGEKSSKYNNKKNPQFKLHILNIKNQQYQLDSTNNDVVLYHLFIMQVLEDAINQGKIYKYHYAMLRQLLESISSFLGVGSFSFALQEIGINQEQTPQYAQIINNLSHDDIYREQMSELNPENKSAIIQIFNALQQKYNFKFKSNPQELIQ
jgi:hypothetical protein